MRGRPSRRTKMRRCARLDQSPAARRPVLAAWPARAVRYPCPSRWRPSPRRPMPRFARALLHAALVLAALGRAAGAQAPAAVQPPEEWTRGATCYEIFVRSFQDSDGDGIGDLKGLISRLDYINDGNPRTMRDLGARCIWLMPVAESPSYHG